MENVIKTYGRQIVCDGLNQAKLAWDRVHCEHGIPRKQVIS